MRYYSMNGKPFWIDGNYKAFEADEVDDAHLKRIVYLLAEGFGLSSFVDGDVIARVFEEAYGRQLMRADLLFVLNLWAEYYWGVGETDKPRHKVSWDGEYIDADALPLYNREEVYE